MEMGAGWTRYAASILFLLMASAVLAPAAPKGQKGAAQKPAVAVPATPAPLEDYVGAETCEVCHAAEMEQFKKIAMAVLLTKKYPVQQRGCEACHGAGRKHAEAMGSASNDQEIATGRTLIYSFRLHTPLENAVRCLGCHEEKRLLSGREKDEKQTLFLRSRHLGAGVTCIDCHDPHLLPGKETAKPGLPLQTIFNMPKRPVETEWLNNRLLRQSEPTLCYSCHQERQADFQLPVRHRVNEGEVKCTDCHNPHGSLNAKEVKGAGVERVCYTCHVEKRGPFVYEHASVRVEGCTACHTPHGSINQHLLIRRQNRQLCLECHVSPQAVNVPHPRLGFQTEGECTRCHVEIHGSNYNPFFLR